MNQKQIQETTIEVFKKVFGASTEVNEYSSADTIENWDSMSHIILIQELEQTFGIKFDLFEIIELRDVKGLVEYIYSKGGV